MEMHPPKPNPKVIDSYLKKWKQLEKYQLQEHSIELLFQSMAPENSVLSHVFLKVHALNDFYSTNIYDTHAVANHILGLKLDKRLKIGDPSLVNDLAVVTIAGKVRTNYSFASKYCCHHNPAKYPIYDYYVDEMLWYYARIDNFFKFKRKDLKDYPSFIEVIQNFQVHYRLTDFSMRQIDIFLWLCGKECFPKTYPDSNRKG
jgi:hypothetical protein